MSSLTHYTNEIALFLTFLFGRFSRDGFKKIYFGVKFFNELHRLYCIVKQNMCSSKVWVRRVNKVIMYGVIVPILLTLLTGSVYTVYWMLT